MEKVKIQGYKNEPEKDQDIFPGMLCSCIVTKYLYMYFPTE